MKQATLALHGGFTCHPNNDKWHPHLIKVLAAHFVPLTDAVLLEAYEWAVDQENSVKDLLGDEIGENLVASMGLGIRS